MSKKIYHQPHDKLYKRCMSDLRVATEIIQHQIPTNLLPLIDFSSLKQESTEFINEKFNLKQADLIFSASIKNSNSKTYFYFLCEHQSETTYLMAFNLIVLSVEIIKNHLNKYPNSSLPIVYPIVLYANSKPWTAPKDIFKLFGEAEAIARAIMFKPFTLIDINRTSDDMLKSQKYAGLFQFALKHRKIKELAVISSFFDALLPWVNELETYHDGIDLAQNVIFYIIECLETENIQLLLKKADQYLSTELRGEVMTLAQAFREQGIQQGVQQGVQVGIEKEKKQIAINLLKKGVALAIIVDSTGLTIDELEKLKTSYFTD